MTEIETPEWVKHAVFYQIFPDRFAKSDRVTKPTNLEPWDEDPTPRGYKGGDLFGVVERLDYLQDLGIDALYFNPIFQSAANHRYHTHDYFRVDPLLGGDDAFDALVAECKRRGIRVVLDGVFNHASRGFFPFNDVLENGAASPWLDWFYIHDPAAAHAYDTRHAAGYKAWAGLRALPKLNTDNPLVREYLMRVGEYWLRKGIDGWRLDVANEIETPGFWREFRRRARAVNPEAYIVGEIWTDARAWLRGDQFDGVMNYQFAAAAIAFATGHRVVKETVIGRGYDPWPGIDAPTYAAKIDRLLGLYEWPITLTQLNLLGSHDTSRVLSIAGGDVSSVKLGTLLMFTFPGAPCIYYGDEIGLTGALPDHWVRGSFPWDHPERWQQDLLGFHKDVIALRKAHPALRVGAFRRLHADGGVYAFARERDGETLVVAVNAGDEPRRVELPLGQRPALPPRMLLSVVGGAGHEVLGTGLALSLPARSGVVLDAGSGRVADGG